MVLANPATLAPASPPFHPSAGHTWGTGLASVGIALAANLTVLAVARLAGTEMVVAQTSIGIGSVAATTVAPLLIATLALLPLRRWGSRAWRLLATTGLAVGFLSCAAPLTVPAEDATRAGLAVMHVITGVVWFLIVRRASARAEA